MTPGRRSRGELRDAMLEQTLDQEEKLVDLRAALAALTVMASASGGIEPDDMPGLRYVARGGGTSRTRFTAPGGAPSSASARD